MCILILILQIYDTGVITNQQEDYLRNGVSAIA